MRDMTDAPQTPVVTQDPAPQTVEPPKEKNVLGLVAFILAIVGFVFSCIPGALIVGWVTLPIALVLAIVAICLKGKPKAMGLAALIISVVGFIVGVVVFFAVVANAVNEAFGGGETTVSAPDSSDASDDAEVVEEGTRENPYPLGTAITQGDWTVTINSVDLDANDALMDENLFNEKPDDGTVYIMVNVTAAYNGDNAEGETPWTGVDYVTSEGNTISAFDKLVVPPEQFDTLETLYKGASTTGNLAIQVPADTAADGVLAVTPTMAGDKVFVAVK